MDEGLESLDNPVACASNLGGGPMWMHGHLSSQRMITFWTAQDNDYENDTKCTNQSDYIDLATSR